MKKDSGVLTALPRNVMVNNSQLQIGESSKNGWDKVVAEDYARELRPNMAFGKIRSSLEGNEKIVEGGIGGNLQDEGF